MRKSYLFCPPFTMIFIRNVGRIPKVLLSLHFAQLLAQILASSVLPPMVNMHLNLLLGYRFSFCRITFFILFVNLQNSENFGQNLSLVVFKDIILTKETKCMVENSDKKLPKSGSHSVICLGGGFFNYGKLMCRCIFCIYICPLIFLICMRNTN